MAETDEAATATLAPHSAAPAPGSDAYLQSIQESGHADEASSR